jgi:hypothetical protein
MTEDIESTRQWRVELQELAARMQAKLHQNSATLTEEEYAPLQFSVNDLVDELRWLTAKPVGGRFASWEEAVAEAHRLRDHHEGLKTIVRGDDDGPWTIYALEADAIRK